MNAQHPLFNTPPVPAPPAMTELDLARTIRDLARTFGWLHVHFRPMQDKRGHWKTPFSGDAGFPDVVLARDGVVLVVELKTDGRKPRPEQDAWLEALGDHGRVWRPRDIDEIATVLSGRPASVSAANP